MIWLRIASFIGLFLSAVFLPWPAVAVLAVVLMTVFSWFWETVFIAFVLGVFYGSSNAGAWLFAFFISAFSAAILAEEYFKKIIEGENIIARVLTVFSGGATIALFWLAFKLILPYV